MTILHSAFGTVFGSQRLNDNGRYIKLLSLYEHTSCMKNMIPVNKTDHDRTFQIENSYY
jgi:hypothetical protein